MFIEPNIAPDLAPPDKFRAEHYWGVPTKGINLLWFDFTTLLVLRSLARVTYDRHAPIPAPWAPFHPSASP